MSAFSFLADRHLSLGGNAQYLTIRQIDGTRHQRVGPGGINLRFLRAIPGCAKQDALAIGSELGAVDGATLESELMEAGRSDGRASSGQKVGRGDSGG